MSFVLIEGYWAGMVALDATESKLFYGSHYILQSEMVIDVASASTHNTDMIRYITDREIYEELICTAVPKARRMLWIATADLKDLYTGQNRHRIPFLEVLAGLARRQVEIRLLHAKKPGPVYWRDYNRFPELDQGMEMMLCPRVHLKCCIVDGTLAYSGSANLTGAGMGAKGIHKRNFEAGFITDEPTIVDQIAEQMDRIWRGDHCPECLRKVYCSAHEDILEK